MNNSSLIVHSTNLNIYACCYFQQTIIIVATTKSLIMWDVLTGGNYAAIEFNQQLAPLSINLVSRNQSNTTILVQDKSGLIIIFTFQTTKRQFEVKHFYNIDMIGFTKIPIHIYRYNQEGQLKKQIDSTFLTIFQSKTIQKREILNGSIKKKFILQKNKFTDITFLINLSFKQKNYLLVAEEGAIIKKIFLQHSQSYQSLIQQEQTFTFESKQQNKIILCIQPITNFKALITLREDRLILFNLQNMSIEQEINHNFIRITKSLNNLQHQFIFAGKKRLGLIRGEKIIKNEQLYTESIINIEICDSFIIGACLQGKLFLWPL